MSLEWARTFVVSISFERGGIELGSVLCPWTGWDLDLIGSLERVGLGRQFVITNHDHYSCNLKNIVISLNKTYSLI